MHGTIPAGRRRLLRRCDNSWTYIESEILREHWPDVAAIRRQLPHRTELAIRYLAKRCGLIPDKVQHIWTTPEDRTLRRMAATGSSRKAMAAELDLTVAQVANRLLYIRVNIAPRRPAPTKDQLAHAIRQRAFDMRLSLRDLDRSLGARKIFSSYCEKKSVSPMAIANAVKALGGELTIQWTDE